MSWAPSSESLNEMEDKKIEGRRIYLRPLSKSDITDKVYNWLKNREVVKFIESAPPKSLKDVADYYENIINSGSNKIFAIIAKDRSAHIGNIKLGNINRKHAFADMGILIGDKSYWGKGYCQEAVRLLLGHAFGALKLQKIFLAVNEDNIAALKAYLNAGFNIEGRIKRLYHRSRGRADRLYLGILKEEFKKS